MLGWRLLTGILHGAGLWQLPKQLYLPAEEKSAEAPNSHLKYVWYDSPQNEITSLVPADNLLCCLEAVRFEWDMWAFAFVGSFPESGVPFLPLTSHHFRCLEGFINTTPLPEKSV